MATNIPYQHGIHESGYVTPYVKASEGINSVGAFYAAPWLPLQRYNEQLKAHVVIGAGKPVAFAGSFLVPAGLALEVKAVKAGDAPTILYTLEDVKNKVQNANKVLVKVGDSVAQGIIDAGLEVSYFAGIANNDYFRHPGGDGWTPSKLDKYNYRPQSSVSFNMDYHYEFPLVATDEDYLAAPYTGVSAFVGLDVKPGQFVTYDKNSNYIVTAKDFTYGDVAPEAILGQVTIVHVIVDPTSKEVLQTIGDLNRVVTPPNHGHTVLDQVPGVDNNGLTQKITYANAYGLIHFGLQTR